MRALLFSNFPERYVRDSIVPKLKARGIEVVKILQPKAAANNPSVDGSGTVLFMHEMASHADDGQVRAFGRRSGLEVVCLSRKSSMWGDRLPKEEKEPESLRAPDNTAPTPAAVIETDTETHTQTEVQAMPISTVRFVPNESVEPMLRIVMEMRDAKSGYNEIVPHVRQFWTNGKLETGSQLQSYLSNVLHRKDCPEFYKRWYAANSLRNNPAKPKTKTETGTTMNAQAAVRLQSLKSLDEKNLDRVLRRIMELKDKGKKYEEILQAIRGAWDAGNAPRNADEMAKFSHTVSRSPRCPAWFKVWYEKARTRTGMKAKKSPAKKTTKAKDDAELAKMYADECEVLKRRVKELEAGPKASKSALAEAKGTLRKLFDGCSKLIDVGAISPKEAFDMAIKYVDNMS